MVEVLERPAGYDKLGIDIATSINIDLAIMQINNQLLPKTGNAWARIIAHSRSITNHQDGPDIDTAVGRIVEDNQEKRISQRITGHRIAKVIAIAQEKANAAELHQAIKNIGQPAVINH